MVIVVDRAFFIHTLNVAGGVGGMPHGSTAAVAWDLFEHIWIGDGKLVGLLDRGRGALHVSGHIGHGGHLQAGV